MVWREQGQSQEDQRTFDSQKQQEASQTLTEIPSQSDLEYELRVQQYVELVRTGTGPKFLEALAYARKHLSGTAHAALGMQAAALLAFDRSTTTERYASLFSPDRWAALADAFLETHHALFSLPSRPLLHIALTAGLSALKTPACHSRFVSPSSGLAGMASPAHGLDRGDENDGDMGDGGDELDSDDVVTVPSAFASLSTPVCPICSTELNRLARNVPYAHHTKSNVENDPVVLPNGRIYGRERLERLNEKLGTPEGLVRDPVEPDRVFEWTQVEKVFIS
jgi:macrophage erythroblast attacher